ncbi:hypothetical protein Hanom_Chr09g00859281 [Helianthus anomalus]
MIFFSCTQLYIYVYIYMAKSSKLNATQLIVKQKDRSNRPYNFSRFFVIGVNIVEMSDECPSFQTLVCRDTVTIIFNNSALQGKKPLN